MAGNIKGITVEIGGDTTKLGQALTASKKESNALQKELKNVNSLLKFDPGNVTLLTQKADLLKKSMEENKKRLELFNAEMDKVKSGEIELTDEEFRALERDIVATENKLKESKKAIKEFGSVGAQQVAAVGEKFKKVGDTISGVGEKMLPLTGAITGIGAVVIKTTADFDASMANVSAISGATGEDLQALRDKAREMGSATKYSASESADAMSYMAMAGWKTVDMINGIEGVMALASATGTDLATTSDILTDGLTAFGLTAADSARMADVMASASSNANTNVLMLGESYKYCASTAGAMGFSLEDITESLGLMANAGVKGSQAGTTLKNAMINLAKPTDAMQGVMDKYNISLTDAEGNMKSWSTIVDDLRVNMGGLSEAEQTNAVATLFGKEATAGMLSLINAAPEDIEKLNSAINNSTGVAQNMADTMNDNLNGQLTILKSQLQELAISFGEMLMPIMKDVVTLIQGFVDKLNNMSEGQRKVILIIMGVVAAIGPLLIVVGKVTSAIGTIMTWAPKIASLFSTLGAGIGATLGPILIIIAVIAVLIGAFKHLWDTNEEFRNNIIQTWEDLKAKFEEFTSGILERVNALGFDFQSFTELLSALWNGLCEVLAPLFEGVWSEIVNILSLAMDLITGLLDFFIGLFTGNWDQCWLGVQEIFSGIWDFIVNLFSIYLNVFTGLADTFCGWFGTTWEEVWTNVSTFFVDIWNGIIDFFSNFPERIGYILGYIIGKVGKFAIDMGMKATEAGKNFIDNAINFIKNLPQNIVTWLTNAIQKVDKWKSDLKTKGGESIKALISAVVDGAKEIPGKMLDIGKNIVNGVWDGIKNAKDNFENNVKNFFGGIVDGAKKALGIHSPSRVFADVVGKQIPAGVAVGIEDNSDVATDAVNSMAEDMVNQELALNGATINRKLNATFSAVNNNAINGSQLMSALNGIYNRLDSLKVVLDSGELVGGIIDTVDTALSNKSNQVVRGW